MTKSAVYDMPLSRIKQLASGGEECAERTDFLKKESTEHQSRHKLLNHKSQDRLDSKGKKR
jgi:hypothetical protein